ncbi:hypothetical protein ACFRIC_39755 [Streptomyces sp. NPDC056738]|uniref:hypothetical protein n=1 Tax=Streptomyces sp. NPDC056738 TaxID=3345933 RepID=UPI0036C6F67F
MVTDATTVDAFNAACNQAKRPNAVFIAVENQSQRWTGKADALTVADKAYDAVRGAVSI